jgi:hypothetical protein
MQAEDEYMDAQAEEYQQTTFKRIEELEQYGISKPDIQKLKAGGYHTIEAVSSSCAIFYMH